MANDDAARGFVPARNAYGGVTTGGIQRFYVAAGESNNIFINDPVDLSGTGDAAGVPGVVLATAGSGGYVVGVVVGFENLTSDNLSKTYRPASTAGYLLVNTDPDMEYIIQEDSVGGALAVADIGLNADFIIGTGSTTTGISATELDSSTKATTATLQCRILGLDNAPDNDVGANARWRVKFNLHRYRHTTGA